MKRASDAPIEVALRKLMADRRLSFRMLAKLTRGADAGGKGLSYAYLSGIARGEHVPALPAIELIARSLGVPASHFAEYRLAEVRHAFDERSVGLDAALRNVEQLLTWLPSEKGELADRLREAAAVTSPPG